MSEDAVWALVLLFDPAGTSDLMFVEAFCSRSSYWVNSIAQKQTVGVSCRHL